MNSRINFALIVLLVLSAALLDLTSFIGDTVTLANNGYRRVHLQSLACASISVLLGVTILLLRGKISPVIGEVVVFLSLLMAGWTVYILL